MKMKQKAQSGALVFFTLLLPAAACFIFCFDGLYGQDAYEYLRYSKALSGFLENGTAPGDYFWPVYYPLLGAVFSLVFSESAVSLWLVTVVSFAVSAVYLFKILVLLFGQKTKALWFTAVFFTLSPIAFRLGTLVMSDMTACACIVLCLYYSIAYCRNLRWKLLAFAAFFGTIAVMTRYAAFVVLLPFGILVVTRILKGRKWLHLLLPLPIIIVALLPHLYIRSQSPAAFLGHEWLRQWSVLNFFQRDFTTVDGTQHYDFPNLMHAVSNAFHVKFFLIGLPLAIFAIMRKYSFAYRNWLFASLMIYALFLAGIPFQNDRFLLLSFPLVLILLFPAFAEIAAMLRTLRLRVSLLFGAVMIQLVLCGLALRPLVARNHLEKSIAEKMRPYQGQTLYAMDIDVALQGRGLEFGYKNLWVEKYPDFETGALVLFNDGRLSSQWRGKNPMLNWETVNQKYGLKPEENLGGDWTLYRIKTKNPD